MQHFKDSMNQVFAEMAAKQSSHPASEKEKESESESSSSGPDYDMTGSCWIKSYFRKEKSLIDHCPEGKEKSGLLCYNKCKSGYGGFGPSCWQYCPPGYGEFAAFCTKPKGYSRGGQWWKDRNHTDRWGLMWFTKCKPGYKPFFCCACNPTCPGMAADIGVSCAKKSYLRDLGSAFTCRPGTEQFGLACMEPCKRNTQTIGPMCWGKCPPGMNQCGAMCQPEGKKCLDWIADVTKDSLAAVTAVVNGDFK